MTIPYFHQSVMTNEVLHYLQPRAGGIYCDATLGGGGHAEAILRATSPTGRVIGIDRDPAAITSTSKRLSQGEYHFLALPGNFGDLVELLAERNITTVDGIIADLGVSSPQFDIAARGFSFQKPGPIDMRMNPTEERSAEDLLRLLSEEELAKVIFHYGEERFSRRIAKAIKQALSNGILTSTVALAQTIALAVPTRDTLPEKAMRTFQALRIAVNDELRQLDRLLKAATILIKEGGRLVVISFHSLEDRMVKQYFQQSSQDISSNTHRDWEILTKKPILPTEAEMVANPRSRSARLRAATRLSARIHG